MTFDMCIVTIHGFYPYTHDHAIHKKVHDDNAKQGVAILRNSGGPIII